MARVLQKAQWWPAYYAQVGPRAYCRSRLLRSMAHQPYRPETAVPLGGGFAAQPGFAAPPPLQFVASSFSEAPQVPLGGAGGSFAAAYPPPAAYGGLAGGSFGLPQSSYGAAPGFGSGATSFEDEPPLLEGARTPRPQRDSHAALTPPPPRWAELGIDVPHIFRKTRSMLRPFRADPALCDDGDLSGPLLFAFALGSCHLLARAPGASNA
jgi:hypothetical protein